MLLIRSFPFEGESLLGYMYRLQLENGYFTVKYLTFLLNMTQSEQRRNIFKESSLQLLSELTNQKIELLTSMTFQSLLDKVHEVYFGQLTFRERIQYCPECLNRGASTIRKEWYFRPISICSIHLVNLVRECMSCGRAIEISNLIKGYCTSCSFKYVDENPQRLIESKMLNFRIKVASILNQEENFKILDKEYSLTEFLFLSYRSFFLMRGMGDLSLGQYSKHHSLEKSIETAFSNVIWIYANFPWKFEEALEIFYTTRTASERYHEMKEFERLFLKQSFPEIEHAYKVFWMKKVNLGLLKRRPVILRIEDQDLKLDNYISKLEASTILGISYRYVNKLIQTGILKQINGDQKIQRDEVMTLLDRCVKVNNNSQSGEIAIRDVFTKYTGKGLSIISIIRFIVSGIITPATSVDGRKLMDATLKEYELETCLQMIEKWKGNSNMKKEVSEINKEMHEVGIGLATITANGMLFSGRMYSNELMIKYQWFEHAKNNGEWQMPIVFRPSEPDHILLLDVEGIEVATSIETNVAIDPDVKQAYFDSINNLKELFFKSNRK
ncbi:hypothetical protein PMSD_21210 [Paenibacillus macquariensis subsp. defensor]|nr:hypothetical protein PMSD_21210 [Paenibacillus macquariensis subsp. defensor]